MAAYCTLLNPVFCRSAITPLNNKRRRLAAQQLHSQPITSNTITEDSVTNNQSVPPATGAATEIVGEGQLHEHWNSAGVTVGGSTTSCVAGAGPEYHQLEKANPIATMERPVEDTDILEQNELREF